MSPSKRSTKTVEKPDEGTLDDELHTDALAVDGEGEALIAGDEDGAEVDAGDVVHAG